MAGCHKQSLIAPAITLNIKAEQRHEITRLFIPQKLGRGIHPYRDQKGEYLVQFILRDGTHRTIGQNLPVAARDLRTWPDNITAFRLQITTGE